MLSFPCFLDTHNFLLDGVISLSRTRDSDGTRRDLILNF